MRDIGRPGPGLRFSRDRPSAREREPTANRSAPRSRRARAPAPPTENAPHPSPLPASGEREGPAKREGEGPLRSRRVARDRQNEVVQRLSRHSDYPPKHIEIEASLLSQIGKQKQKQQ